MPTTISVLLAIGARVLAGPPPATPAGVRSIGGWALETGAGGRRVERVVAAGRGAAGFKVGSATGSSNVGAAGGSGAVVATDTGCVARTGAREGWFCAGALGGTGVADEAASLDVGGAGDSVGASATGV